MTRELQLRDEEILDVLQTLMMGEPDEPTIDAAWTETAKICDCDEARIYKALAAVQDNGEHLYWKA